MRHGGICCRLLFTGLLAVAVHSTGWERPAGREGPFYLGENPPGRIPKVFAPGVISDAGFRLHGALVVSPDLRRICWSVVPPAVLSIVLTENGWTDPVPLPLEGRGVQAPAFSNDGRRLYYQGVLEQGKGGIDIWWKRRVGNGWDAPVNAGPELNSEKLESQPSVAADGTLYFTGTLEGSGLDRGIYRSRLVAGAYAEPELLGDGINSPYIDYCPWIASDESCLFFASSRPRHEEVLYLHVSFLRIDGSWTEPVNVHPVLDFDRPARFPSLSPDGRFLFFLSEGKIYWVESAAVLELGEAGRRR